ncbi:adenylosuccinate lyase [Moorella thermoacetica]|uniref:Adenylosuccinate lyase n=1 Tax=Moorella thermoacetica (strain ATCC 39073 / JCM 9320) TaxID=264732 RepID=Q2RGU1_MOOTA|nr:adenylosuccinate lyase [Moorella thermoacetica]AKX94883.1 adenylosuccinate lyase [Moorella thermoacetica]AKX97513.1 adenylosuccinate lyase [Moorella thermoacetica]OIQ57068.1 adenylosuccinate lyase [Moorella thermoacetica]QDA01340.1 Adenylosuccinate lyase [Moorella thermoacetica]TYL10500.1 Adenylosuccinate lyase [Moorella thermoacetica]
MIERYTLPEMGKIWEPEHKFRTWLAIEIYACEAWAELGRIPPAALEEIKARADFDIDRINEIEATTRHDVLAFLTAVAEKVGDASKYIHLGMTSSDVLDTALAVQMRDAADLLLKRLRDLRAELVKKAMEHKYTLMIGRTHGVHAEPTTFGLKMALWVMEVDRHLIRLEQAKEMISVGKISGAVGTFANINPRVEEHVCRRLGLKPASVSTQIIQRDRHAQFLATLAIIGSSLEKMATEIRNLQRTDILEVEEPFAKGQKGSSAMPHKRNPIISERVAGLSRVLRGNALAAMEDIALWHERDLTHSSVERVIIPDSTILLDYMLVKFTGIIAGLNVYPENMRRNLEATHGLVFSQRVLLALVNKGVLRETAYAWVQRNALKAWQTRQPFKELVLKDQDIMSRLDPKEVEALFDYDYHLRHVDYIFRRAGLE